MAGSKFSVFYHKYPTESGLLDCRHYFEEYKKRLDSADSVRGKNIFDSKKLANEFYSAALGISPEEVEELHSSTCVSELQCEGEIGPIDHELHQSNSNFTVKYEMGELSKNTDHCLQSVEKRMEVPEELYSRYNLKYEQYIWVKSEKNMNDSQNLNPFDFSTVVFCVKVYHPYLSFKGHCYRLKLLQEIHVLGNQTLSDLRDKILCSMDFTGIHDISNCINSKLNTTDLNKREDFTSSFIFIENKFYNDTRDPLLMDLSKTIIDWGNAKGLGPFSTGSMQGTKMMDLKIRIGHPYVYQHQADCEHVIVISDVRFLQPDDPLQRCSFPRVYARGRCDGRFCMMCGVVYARWYVFGSERLTHDKNYFCDKCFKSYNYVNKEKIGNFKAYKYIDPIAIL